MLLNALDSVMGKKWAALFFFFSSPTSVSYKNNIVYIEEDQKE